jgi:hypothetical protein
MGTSGKYSFNPVTDVNLYTGSSDRSFGFVTDQIKRAKQAALAKIDEQINKEMEGGPLNIHEFKAVGHGARDISTQKIVPVEWEAKRRGRGRPGQAGTWTVMLNMEDVPDPTKAMGPPHPHIGYTFWFNGPGSTTQERHTKGHVLVDHVPASRMRKDLRGQAPFDHRFR